MSRRHLVFVFGLMVFECLAVRSTDAQGVPLPKRITDTYAAKFICGVQADADITSVPDAQAGRYSTKINVHNNTGVVVKFRKKAIRLRGDEVPTDPAQNKPLESLSEDQAMEVVCRDVYKLLSIPPDPKVPPPYIEGFVIFEVYYQTGKGAAPPPADPLDVEGIYTYRGELPPGAPPSSGVGPGLSMEVVVFPAKRNGHDMH